MQQFDETSSNSIKPSSRGRCPDGAQNLAGIQSGKTGVKTGSEISAASKVRTGAQPPQRQPVVGCQPDFEG